MKHLRHNVIRNILWNYAFMFTLVRASDSLMLAVGSACTKTVGPVALAANGLSSPTFVIGNILAALIATGMQTLCSAAMSSGDKEKTNIIFSTCTLFTVLLAAAATVAGFVLLDPICRFCGASSTDPELYGMLRAYLRGWFIGIPGFLGFFVLSPLVNLDGNKKCIAAASAAMLIENVAVDFIAITYMKDGIWGIGLATGIGYNVAALIMLANFFRKRSAFRFSPKHVKPTVLFSVVKLGTPNLTRQGCRLIAPLTINRMILAVGGSAAMAAMSVLNTLLAICTSPGNGVSRSVDLLAQIYHSEQDRPALRRIATEAMRLLILTSAPFIVGVLIFAKPLASFYIHGDPVALKYTVIAMICLSFTILPNAANFTVMDYLRGCRQLLPTHLYTFSHMLLWKLIATFTLTRLFGVTGVFVAIPVAEFLTIGVYVLLTLMLKRNGAPMDRVLLLPKDFGHAAEDTLAFTVTTVEEAVQGSEKIGAFCKARGVDERRTLYAALCSEELLANVVTHGFTKDHKAHSCDVRVMKEGDDVILRIRDDCRYFNLKERYEAITASTVDVTSHIGIRMVYAMAKDIRYVNLLDTNTLIIRI